MNAMIREATLLAVTVIGIMIVLVVVLADKLARQVLRPIGRFVRYAERIANRDFSPLHPARRSPAPLNSPSAATLASFSRITAVSSRRSISPRTS